MLHIRTILHPTNFSAHSRSALALACALSRDYGAKLVVFHALEVPVVYAGEGIMLPAMTEEYRAEAEEHLRQLKIPPSTIKPERLLAEGEAATEILRVCEDVGADIIVMGTHGRTGIERFLMGSVSEDVVRRAKCPVVTISKPLSPATLDLPAEDDTDDPKA